MPTTPGCHTEACNGVVRPPDRGARRGGAPLPGPLQPWAADMRQVPGDQGPRVPRIPPILTAQDGVTVRPALPFRGFGQRAWRVRTLRDPLFCPVPGARGPCGDHDKPARVAGASGQGALAVTRQSGPAHQQPYAAPPGGEDVLDKPPRRALSSRERAADTARHRRCGTPRSSPPSPAAVPPPPAGPG